MLENFFFVFVGEAFKRRYLHFWNPSDQWWGQFAEMDKFSFLVNFRSIHSIHSTVQLAIEKKWYGRVWHGMARVASSH